MYYVRRTRQVLLREVIERLVYHYLRASPAVENCIVFGWDTVGIALLNALVLLNLFTITVSKLKRLDDLLELECEHFARYVLFLRDHLSIGVLDGNDLLRLVNFTVLNAVIKQQ